MAKERGLQRIPVMVFSRLRLVLTMCLVAASACVINTGTSDIDDKTIQETCDFWEDRADIPELIRVEDDVVHVSLEELSSQSGMTVDLSIGDQLLTGMCFDGACEFTEMAVAMPDHEVVARVQNPLGEIVAFDGGTIDADGVLHREKRPAELASLIDELCAASSEDSEETE